MLFQLALAAGAPLGDFAMGGAYPGRFPPPPRAAAAAQGVIIAALAAVVLARARLALPRWQEASRVSIWLVVGVSDVSAVSNTITPSVPERTLWAPVGIGMFVSSLVVALRGRRSSPRRSVAHRSMGPPKGPVRPTALRVPA